MVATLPANRRERVIADMRPGDQAWTLPWAMSADARGLLWLRGDYPIRPTEYGTMSMAIRRRISGGYEVDVPPGEDYREGESLHPAWRPIPVEHANWLNAVMDLDAEPAPMLLATPAG